MSYMNDLTEEEIAQKIHDQKEERDLHMSELKEQTTEEKREAIRKIIYG